MMTWLGGTPYLVGGVPHHDLTEGYSILTWLGGKGPGTNGRAMGWRWVPSPVVDKMKTPIVLKCLNITRKTYVKYNFNFSQTTVIISSLTPC